MSAVTFPTAPPLRSGDRLVTWAAGLGAATVYAPIGLSYLFGLLLLLLFVALPGRGDRMRQALALPGAWCAVAFIALLAVSGLWSPAPADEIGSHLWHYALVVLVFVIPALMTPAQARTALTTFSVVSVACGGLLLLKGMDWLPEFRLWHNLRHYDGNRSISNALLLMLGASLCLFRALEAHPARSRWQRAGWLAGVAVIGTGLVWQMPSRAAMLGLPLALVSAALLASRSWRQVAAVVIAVVSGSVLAWNASTNLQERFREGIEALHKYEAGSTEYTSWGTRSHMIRASLEMVADRPLLGHGAGSWLGEWHKRGPQYLSKHVTAHNEYLMIAAQVGLVGLALALLVAWKQVRAAWLASPVPGAPALLVWFTVAWGGLFNVVLRDSAFGLPLLMLAGITMTLVLRAGPAGRSPNTVGARHT